MKRRVALTTLSGVAAALTLGARAQNAALPVIGFLSRASPDMFVERLRAFRESLKEAGYVEGQNVRIEYRWAEDQDGRLPSMASELVRLHVAVIVANGDAAALAAKVASGTIPIVFGIANDPVQLGFVSGLNRPGGNLTGVINLNVETAPKRLELLHELLPNTSVFALLVDPNSPTAEAFSRSAQEAARKLRLQLHVLQASTESDINTALATLAQLRVGGLIIGPSVFLVAKTGQLAALTVHGGVPAIFEYRAFVAAGGLLSYGTSETEYYRLVGTYTTRILKGEKPSELPVQQVTKIELFINLKTARAFGITVPPSLLARADEVIQ